MRAEAGLYNVEVLINLKYSLIAMITCSVYKQWMLKCQCFVSLQNLVLGVYAICTTLGFVLCVCAFDLDVG